MPRHIAFTIDRQTDRQTELLVYENFGGIWLVLGGISEDDGDGSL